MLRASEDEDLLLPFAEHRGRIVHISEVTSDDRTGFACPKCHEHLVPVLGQVRRHHFRHHVEAGCYGSAETAIHQCAKEILLQHKTMAVPAKEIIHQSTRVLIACAETLRFEDARAEMWHGSIKPDVTLWCADGSAFFVEIRYSHPVPPSKADKLCEMRVPCVEIDVRDAASGEHFDRRLLETILIRDAGQVKQWLCFPGIEEHVAQLKQQLEEKERLHRLALERERALADAERERVRLTEVARRTQRESEGRTRVQAQHSPTRRRPHRLSAETIGAERPQYTCFAYPASKWQPFVYDECFERCRLGHEVDPEAVASHLIRLFPPLLKARGQADKAEVAKAIREYFCELALRGMLTEVSAHSGGPSTKFVVTE